MAPPKESDVRFSHWRVERGLGRDLVRPHVQAPGEVILAPPKEALARFRCRRVVRGLGRAFVLPPTLNLPKNQYSHIQKQIGHASSTDTDPTSHFALTVKTSSPLSPI